MKTEYLFYIYTNTQYSCSENDAQEFNAALKCLTEKIDYATPTGTLDGSNYLGAYIIGMYPELEKPIKFFHDEIDKYRRNGCSDSVMKSKALTTMSKFGLKRNYDFENEPNAEQFQRINNLVRNMQKKDLSAYASPLFRNMGLALMQIEKDYRPVHEYINKIKIMNEVACEVHPEELVKKHTYINGVPEGLAFLSLKKQGILNDKLEIADMDKFCNTKIVKEFAIGKKSYDLSKGLKQIYSEQNNLVQSDKQRSM